MSFISSLFSPHPKNVPELQDSCDYCDALEAPHYYKDWWLCGECYDTATAVHWNRHRACDGCEVVLEDEADQIHMNKDNIYCSPCARRIVAHCYCDEAEIMCDRCYISVVQPGYLNVPPHLPA